jgi:hypothetical protein
MPDSMQKSARGLAKIHGVSINLIGEVSATRVARASRVFRRCDRPGRGQRSIDQHFGIMRLRDEESRVKHKHR